MGNFEASKSWEQPYAPLGVKRKHGDNETVPLFKERGKGL